MKKKPESPKPQKGDCMQAVISGYERTIRLGTFADSGRAPKIKDVEVVVCFADVRGFTSYVHSLQKDGQDNKVQHFLKKYFEIYPQAVLRSIWDYEPDLRDNDMTSDDTTIQRFIIPTSYKNLGDGMMLVWEIQDLDDARLQGLVTRAIFKTIGYIQEHFTYLTTQIGPVELDAFSHHAAKLKMGFGISRGHAWRLDFGHHVPIDYAGSVVNLASRLQGLARPEGIVAQLGFSESLLRELSENESGKISKIPAPKGLGADPIDTWSSTSVLMKDDKIKNVVISRKKPGQKGRASSQKRSS